MVKQKNMTPQEAIRKQAEAIVGTKGIRHSIHEKSKGTVLEVQYDETLTLLHIEHDHEKRVVKYLFKKKCA